MESITYVREGEMGRDGSTDRLIGSEFVGGVVDLQVRRAVQNEEGTE
jgi:hypothetical protein